MNFDANFDASRFRFGTGIVSNSASSKVIGSRVTLHSNVASPFEVKAIACTWAVKSGLDLGASGVIIERDYLTVINKCKLKTNDTSKIGAYFTDI